MCIRDSHYDEEREKIGDFLAHFKAPASSVPPLSRVGPRRRSDDDAPAQLIERDLEAEGMDALDAVDETLMRDTFSPGHGAGADGVPGAADGDAAVEKYRVQLQRIANRDQEMLVIELDDIAQFRNAAGRHTGASLVAAIKGNARHYLDLFYEVIDRQMPDPDKDISDKDDVLDVIRHQRMQRNALTEEQEEATGDVPDVFPPALLRRYRLYFRPQRSDTPLAVRPVSYTHLTLPTNREV